MRLNLFRKLLAKEKYKILSAVKKSWLNIDFNQSEPNIIFDYLQQGLRILNQEIPPLFKNYGFIVKFAGVFIHQKPIVTPLPEVTALSRKSNCELGDLLVVWLYLDDKKKVIYSRAFISQAKKKAKIDSECQRYLYEEANSYRYARNCKEKNKEERLLPNFLERLKGLNYLILNSTCFYNDPYIRYIPFDAGLSLAWNIYFFLTLYGFTGLEFFYYNYHRKDWSDWSLIVRDLIDCVGRAFFKDKPRGSYLEEFINKFNDFDKIDNYFIKVPVEGDEEGISILFIIIQDKGGKKKVY
jgi:hypothetical protein